MTVCSMSVAHREEMQAKLLEHVGHEDVRVLILFVRIAGLVTYGRGESKLGNTIESLSRSLHTLARVTGCGLTTVLLALWLALGSWCLLAAVGGCLLLALERLVVLRGGLLSSRLLLSERLRGRGRL